ncbi:MAG: 4-oxalocrotonate tautomerase [Thermoleophilaceae bacterium]|jgi:4-oxalocrotonate tautomerase family enzyme|nr:4-oxalocrotonate tautomerase [Thermoleophilaceae bacterium]
MPLVRVTVVEGSLSRAQQDELVEQMTAAIARVGGEELASVAWVLIDEVPGAAWGVGGRPVAREAPD